MQGEGLIITFDTASDATRLPRRAPAPSEPSAVAARLHVISSTCRLAGPLPGTSAPSHSAYSCLGDRQAHVCCLRKGVVDVLRKA